MWRRYSLEAVPEETATIDPEYLGEEMQASGDLTPDAVLAAHRNDNDY